MEKHRIIKVLTASLVTAGLFVTSLGGCAQKPNQQSTKEPDKDVIVSAKVTDKPISLKYVTPLQHPDVVSSHGDIEAFKEIEKKTGVHIEWIHPADNAAQYIKLLFASNDLPDIIQTNDISGLPGSPDQLIDDKVILRLNEIIDKNAPSFKKLITQNPEIARQAKTDKGNIYSFFKMNDEEPDVYAGPKVRKDLLEKYNLPVPVTIDEWYNLLKTMKNDGIEIPLMLEVQSVNAEKIFGTFMTAYGIAKEFYLSGNKVMYGPYQAQYKDYLTTLHKWYAEGLIPNNWRTLKATEYNALAVAGKIGAAASNTKFGDTVVIGTLFPVLKKGETPKTFRKVEANAGSPAVITTVCNYPNEAVKWFDYCYSEEGSNFLNWGVEGVSYKMVDGKAMAVESIVKDPNSVWKYRYNNGPFLTYKTKGLQTPDNLKTEAAYQNVKNLAIWSSADRSMAMPTLTLTPAEQQKYDSVMPELTEYVNLMYGKFVTGEEPIGNFDAYISNLKNRGIEDIIKIQQTAYERFLKR